MMRAPVVLLALALALLAAPALGARVPTREHVLTDEPEPPVWPKSFEVRRKRGRRRGVSLSLARAPLCASSRIAPSLP